MVKFVLLVALAAVCVLAMPSAEASPVSVGEIAAEDGLLVRSKREPQVLRESVKASSKSCNTFSKSKSDAFGNRSQVNKGSSKQTNFQKDKVAIGRR